MSTNREQLRTLLKHIVSYTEECRMTATVGFDGCIDTILRPVRQRLSGSIPRYFETITEFGAYLETKSGLSCAIEVEQVSRRFGGNGPNLAAALTTLGVKTACVGNLGAPEPCFKGTGAELYSVGGTGTCSALQFSDGKVMLSNMQVADEVTFDSICAALGRETVQKLFCENQGAAFVNWAEMPAATGIWRGIVEQFWAAEPPKRDRVLLVDLTDCSRRAEDEIREVADVCAKAGKYRRVVWSLNAGEAELLAKHFRCPAADAVSRAVQLRISLSADVVVIHDIACCALSAPGTAVEVPGFPVEHPRISVGGGDTFNGALLFSLMCGFSPEECALFAGAFSSAYVQMGTYIPLKQLYEQYN